ncbi:DUF4932 domain-containing protein, partial [bacterium]|nr:DUF4932 domain-containing protein [bacterium]
MRKSKLFFFIIYLTLFLLEPLIIQAVDESSNKKEIKIVVDPRIELLAAVQILSDYDEQFGRITDFDFP